MRNGMIGWIVGVACGVLVAWLAFSSKTSEETIPTAETGERKESASRPGGDFPAQDVEPGKTGDEPSSTPSGWLEGLEVTEEEKAWLRKALTEEWMRTTESLSATRKS